MDTRTTGWIDLGARQGAGLTNHVLLGTYLITSGSYPQRLYSWTWTGSAWGQPETDTGIDQDYGHSMEKNAPAGTTDIGYIWYDDEGDGAGADCVWFERVANLSRPPLVAYSESNSSYDDIVQVRSLNGADWGSESDAYDTNDSGALKWHVAATSADRSRQAVIAVGSGGNTLYASLYDGSSWTTTSLGTVNTSSYRCFAAAYEQQSGQLLIAAATSTTNQIKYWVHDGSSWVVDGSTYTFNDSDGLYGTLNWLRMDARPDSNQIAMILRSNGNHAGALIWDGEGNAWGNDKKLSISGATPTADNLCNADVKYMRAGPYKGRAVFVWPNSSTTLYSWTWTGGYWESAYKPKTSAASSSILWVELAADPNSSLLLAALGDSNEDLYTVDWTGSSWGTARSVSTDLLPTTWYGRRYAVSFESGTSHKGHVVITYSDSANLKYRHTSDIAGAWGSETNISTSYDCNWVELALDADNTIHLMCQEVDGPDDLLAYRWDNSSWTSEGVLETDLQYDGNGTYEAFAITTYPPKPAETSSSGADLGPLLGFSVSYTPSWVTRYSTWDGSDFSEAMTGPAFGSWVNIWGNEQALETGLTYSNNFHPVGVEYIQSGTGSGKAMFVWSASSQLESRTWNGSSWDGELTPVGTTTSACYLRLHADPNSNKMVCALVRANWTGMVVIFNGTSWDSAVTVDTVLGHAYRPIDAIFETASGHEGDILVVYSDAANLRYVHADWNGSTYSWGSEADVSADYDGLWVQLECAAGDTILLAVRDNSTNKLGTWSWNNSSFTFEKAVTSSLTSLSQSHQPFYLSPHTGAVTAGVTQAHYRWRNDDGSESAATFALAEDNKMGIAKETPKRLRFLVKNTGAMTASGFQLQVAETGTLNVGTNEFTEVEFSIQATTSATTDGDYCFRLYDANQVSELGAYTNYAGAQVLGVTAIRLLEFLAQGAGQGVEVFWRTGQEVKNKGFDLYRAASASGPWVKLNTAGLIPSDSESGEGRSYLFVDAGAVRGRICYYRLEDVDTSQTHTPHGPICVDWDAVGLADDWEIAHGLNPQVNDALRDADADGVSNALEYRRGTDPFNRDSDGDGVLDGAESKGPSAHAGGTLYGPGVEVLGRDATGLVLELVTTGFDAARVSGQGQEFERLSLPGYVHGYTRATGLPELPVKGVLVEVPEGKSAKLTILSEDRQLLPGYRVYPVPAQLPGEAGELLEAFAWDEAAYAAAELRPASVAELSTAYVYRGKTQQRILFYPLRFNGATGELTFSRRIRVQVEFVEVVPAAASLKSQAPAAA